MRWHAARTRVVDAGGKRLLPGFNDAHVHFSDGGASLVAVQLNDAASLAEFVERIGDYGHDRASRTYAFRTFQEHGVRLAFGTDWPVAPLNPILTLYAAVTRATLDGKQPNGWFPEQKMSIQDAIAAYTMGTAFAELQEHDKGSIEPGKLADLVLLDRDVLTLPTLTTPQSLPPHHAADVSAETRKRLR